jgi:hypothetical protein
MWTQSKVLITLRLKGQCHEMVIEMIPWSSSLGQNNCNGRGPFFLLENRPSESDSLLSTTFIDIKTGSLDLADFATTRRLFPRTLQFAQGLE